MKNIPIYRAFSETFDNYILGVPYFSDGKYYMLVDDCNKNKNIGSGSYPIDETTLSINFPEMLDSERNKIFASLDKYYTKGADIVENDNFLGDYNLQIAIYSDGCFYTQDKDGDTYSICQNWQKLKVIGIQQ